MARHGKFDKLDKATLTMVAASSSSGSEEQLLEDISDDAFSLKNILGNNHDSLEHPGANDLSPKGWDEESSEKFASEGFCVECEGTTVRIS
jgi:hypothetical protein